MNDLTASTRDVPASPVSEGDGKVRLSKRSRKVATERSERAAERISSRITTLAFASVLMNFILALGWFVAENKPPKIFLLGETNGKFYQARGPIENADVMRTLMEKFARRYVAARETVNLVDDDDRFKWVREQSTTDVWKIFDRAMSEGEYYKAAVRNHTTWSVRVISAWQSNEANPAVWSLEIEKNHFTFNRKRGPTEHWIVELKLGRDGRKKTPDEQLDNPAALYVLKYSARAKDTVVSRKKS